MAEVDDPDELDAILIEYGDPPLSYAERAHRFTVCTRMAADPAHDLEYHLRSCWVGDSRDYAACELELIVDPP